MSRIKFGAFLAPHHPIGENPTLQFRSDLDFVTHLTVWAVTNSGAASIIPPGGR